MLPTFSVPPRPIEVGMVRNSLPPSKTLTCLVASSATDTCEAPMVNVTGGAPPGATVTTVPGW